MISTLPYDIFPIIFKFFQYDTNTLFSCVLTNRTISTFAIPVLWRNPFMSNKIVNQYKSALLIRTYLSCFTEEERNYLKDKGVKIRDFRKPIFDYVDFLKEIPYCYSIHDSILYWILLEYRNYTEDQLNDIKNVHQFNEREIQYPLINSIYHMFLKKNTIRSLGISIDTLKIIDPIDYQLFEDTNTSNLSNLTVYLKDYYNEDKQSSEFLLDMKQSFEFLLDMIKKWCYNINCIKVQNLSIFNNNNQKIPKVQEIINQQRNLQKLDLLTTKKNIAINSILSNLKNYKYNYLTEMEIQDTDLSDISKLEGLASIHSLKSLFLFQCKGISRYNIFTLSNSLIVLKKLTFINNDFPLKLIISTIGKSLKELETDQLDKGAVEFLSESLTDLDVGINSNMLHIFYDLIKRSKIIHLKVKCLKNSTEQILNDLGSYLPISLKYLGLFTFRSFNVKHLENILINCNVDLESLEVFGAINYNLLVVILDYIKKNRNFKCLIIDSLNNLNIKEKETELLLKDVSKYGRVIFNT